MQQFSIIVPVYNVASYLEECLDSVLAQTFGDWECLCVNDGSKDISGDILDDYVRQDPRFKVTHQQNGGLSVARNRALRGTLSGQYVLFLDSDDCIVHTALEQIVPLCKLENPDVIYWKWKNFKDGETLYPLLGGSPLGSDKKYYKGNEAFRYFLENKVFYSFCWCGAFRKEIAQSVEFPVGVLYEDLSWTARVAHLINFVVDTDLELLLYRSRSTSITGSRTAAKFRSYLRSYQMAYEAYLSNPNMDVNFAKVHCDIFSRALIQECVTMLCHAKGGRSVIWDFFQHFSPSKITFYGVKGLALKLVLSSLTTYPVAFVLFLFGRFQVFKKEIFALLKSASFRRFFC